MKKYAILLFFAFICFYAFAESYKINEVSYDMKGLTRQYALSQKVPLDTTQLFSSTEKFETYIEDIRQLLNNQRVFQTSDITLTYLEENEDGVIPVNVLISTVDTLNIICVPYPSYNSNSGITLKLKLKDYNFFGSMETMTFDLNYQADSSDEMEDVSHIYGLTFGFEIPFNLIAIPTSWDSNFKFSYTYGNPEMDMSILEGLNFSIPIGEITSLDFAFNQNYFQNSNYIDISDDKYFQEAFSLSLPFTIATIPNWFSIRWTPAINFTYNWDKDAFEGEDYGGMTEESLRGPLFKVSHSFSGKRINWLGNFRDGISASLNQSYAYNFYDDTDNMNLTFSSQYYKKLCSFIGFSSRQYWYKNYDDSAVEFGSMIRGIRDSDLTSSDFIVLNLDFPFSVFKTHWGKWLGWDKLNYVDFECQLSPFFDMVCGYNTYADSYYNFKDGWYGTGLEVIVFPERFRSIQCRASFGIDLVQFLEKQSEDKPDLQETTDILLNTNWRQGVSSGWYELSIGVGLFY
ncbi:MAG: hypothetical protein KBT02_02690 [Treponema sp.]|nr:hypothetical protein [Candidatus Treponema caballi]